MTLKFTATITQQIFADNEISTNEAFKKIIEFFKTKNCFITSISEKKALNSKNKIVFNYHIEFSSSNNDSILKVLEVFGEDVTFHDIKEVITN